jgi:NAD(P)-dependent dehydrogenase (short-subunit alcohol dehydrogenase family)
MKTLSIVVGSKGLIGSAICKSLKKRGDILIKVEFDTELIDIIYKLKKKKFTNLNIIFAQIFKETKSTSKKINNKKFSLFQYRKKIISSWLKSESSEYLKAIENQICFVDDFLKKIFFNFKNDMYRKNILFFGSNFEKKQMLEYFHKNKFFFFKHPAYSVSKKALIAYQNFLCDMFFDKNIYINTISPGVIERNQKNEFVNFIKKKTPINSTLIDIPEITDIVLFLTSNNSIKKSSINNQIIYADRGFSATN